MDTVSFAEIKKISRRIYPDLPVGGKGITKTVLIDRVCGNDYLALPRIKYVILDENIGYDIIRSALSAPDLRDFKYNWKDRDWRPIVEFCKEITTMDVGQTDSVSY